MSTLIRSEAVAFFAARVRAQLSGVDPEVLDELTDGLAADLTEALLDAMPDGEDPVAHLTGLAVEDVDARFGSPADYAAELAAAADVVVPPAGDPEAQGHRSVRSFLTDTRAGLLADASGFAERHPWAGEARDMLRTLRPVWWLVRALALAMIVTSMFGWAGGGVNGLVPHGSRAWLVVIVLGVVSVQWGRGRFGQGRWQRRSGLALSVVAGFATLVGLATTGVMTTDRAWNDGYQAGVAQLSVAGTNGAVVGGEVATNLFVFDAAGEPVDGAQIVDQAGRPLVLGAAEPFVGSWEEWRRDAAGWEEGRIPSAALERTGQLNVFPYIWVDGESAQWNDMGLPEASASSRLMVPVWPAATLLPVDESRPATLVGSEEPASSGQGAAEPTELTTEPTASPGAAGAEVP